MSVFPTLRHLQYLIALSDHGQFQKAAEACHVTQSTLSAGIVDLEAILGGVVIDRTRDKRGLRFTDLGQDTLATARRMLSLAQSLMERAQSLQEPLSSPLRMGIIPTIAPYLLPRFLKPLQKALPKLELHIHEMQSDAIVQALENGTLDFALMAFPFDTKGLMQHILFEESFVCAAPPGSFKTTKSIRLEDLEPYKLLLLEDGHCMRDHALSSCKWPKAAPTKTLSAASLSTLIQLVHQGYGMTLLPEMALSDKGALPKNMTLRPFSGNAPRRKIGFCSRKSVERQRDIDLVEHHIAVLLGVEGQNGVQKRLK